MALTSGTRLGVYEITAQIGAGGMGEVYRARDTKLDRDVAIKVLPELFVSDPERVARFRREAKTLAALNHPHIGGIYGLEEADGVRALVLELVDGEDLTQRIARGALPVRAAIGIAAQIVDALEAAHAQQIIHRDLKPANVKVRADGNVKLLDFGIAKVVSEAHAGSDTVWATGATHAGSVVGTAPYMSPEQALGQPVDKRTDIWAFGCLLYEMLTGQTPFRGHTLSATISALLEKEIDWNALPVETPAAVRRLLRRCLTRDPRHRLADIADARLELEEDVRVDRVDDMRVGHTRVHWIWPFVAASAGALVAAVLISSLRSSPRGANAVNRLAILPPAGERFVNGTRAVMVSPDGSRLVITTNQAVYVRAMDGFEMRRLPVDVNSGVGNGAFSPDGSQLALMGMQVIDLSTGARSALPRLDVGLGGVLGSMTWTDRGLVTALGAGGVWLLPRGASKWEPLIQLDAGEATSAAQLLPDGQHVLLTLLSLGGSRVGQVVVQRIKTRERTVVVDGGADAHYIGNGYIVYVQNGVLLAQRFDVKALKAAGAPVRLVEGVQSANILNATMQYAVSDNGTLVYVPGQPMPATSAMDLVFSDRQGAEEHLHLPPAPYETPRMSPDGRMLAVGTDDGREASVWVRDLAGASSIRRLTIGARNRFPVWSADGKRLAFQSDRDGDLAIFSQAADGSDGPTRLTKPEAGTIHVPESSSPTHLLFSAVRGGTASLWTLSLADKSVAPFAGVTSNTLISASFSPDGRWVAYTTSNALHVHTVYVRPFSSSLAVYEISRNDDGHHPVWSHDGRELVYIPGPRRLVAVQVQFTPSFSFSPPQPLPPAGLMGPGDFPRNHDILPDGKRFIGRQIAEDEEGRAGGGQRIQVVTNLFEDIKRRQ